MRRINVAVLRCLWVLWWGITDHDNGVPWLKRAPGCVAILWLRSWLLPDTREREERGEKIIISRHNARNIILGGKIQWSVRSFFFSRREEVSFFSFFFLGPAACMMMLVLAGSPWYDPNEDHKPHPLNHHHHHEQQRGRITIVANYFSSRSSHRCLPMPSA